MLEKLLLISIVIVLFILIKQNLKLKLIIKSKENSLHSLNWLNHSLFDSLHNIGSFPLTKDGENTIELNKEKCLLLQSLFLNLRTLTRFNLNEKEMNEEDYHQLYKLFNDIIHSVIYDDKKILKENLWELETTLQTKNSNKIQDILLKIKSY